MWSPPKFPRSASTCCARAFMATMQDPGLVAEAKRMQVDVMPVAGQDLQGMIADLYATPKDVLEKARQAMAAK